MAKTLTFISRHAPYGSSRPRACMDMALAAAVFDQTVHYVFTDDGVWQLQKTQQADSIHARNLGSALPAMALYGIGQVIVCAASLEERQLMRDDLLPLNIEVLSEDGIRQLIEASDQVFTF